MLDRLSHISAWSHIHTRTATHTHTHTQTVHIYTDIILTPSRENLSTVVVVVVLIVCGCGDVVCWSTDCVKCLCVTECILPFRMCGFLTNPPPSIPFQPEANRVHVARCVSRTSQLWWHCEKRFSKDIHSNHIYEVLKRTLTKSNGTAIGDLMQTRKQSIKTPFRRNACLCGPSVCAQTWRKSRCFRVP